MKIKHKDLINCSFPLNPISLFIKSPCINESKVSWYADVLVVDSIYDSKIIIQIPPSNIWEVSVCV